jgi:glutaminyl-tRNA synthetase
MNSGEVPEGKMVLRAKIDMSNSNMHFRDPIMYRIIDHPHHRTGTTWHAYPMYDFAHGESDYFEGVTHSICTLEFEVHRPLYNYFINLLKKDETYYPRQIEFNRLNLTYTVMSKRKLLTLVKENLVKGWDDPRMPTICGLRRRGYSPEAILRFIESIGYTKYDGLIDLSLLESAAREDLNARATRVSAVLDPVKLVITNYPEGKMEAMDAIDNPEDENSKKHQINFGRELWIERADFMEEAPKKYFRMAPDKEVRLKNAYIVKCTGCKKDESGKITEVYCEYDPDTKSGMPGSERKVKGTLHWVNINDCLPCEVRLYDRLFMVENPALEEKEHDFRELLNPESLKVINGFVEPYVKDMPVISYLQFQRIGYFDVDYDSTPDHLVFNKTVGLKDSWGKIQNKK